MTGPECHSGIACVRVIFGCGAAFHAIEPADHVSADLDYAVLHAFALTSRLRTPPCTIT